MRPLLLDTIVLLWWLAGDGRLDLALVHRIKLPKQPVYVSVATSWEICALEREGQVTFGKPARECLPAELSSHRMQWLPIDHRHVFLAQQLPRDTLDAYDRLILAQAAVEGLTLVTTNDQMRAPGVETLEGRTRDTTPLRALPIATARSQRRAPLPPADHSIPDWNAFPWGGTLISGGRPE